MPSKSQKQADMMEHAAHDEAYAIERLGPKNALKTAREFNGEDIRAGEWGKTEDGVCGKVVKDENGDELPPCDFSGPRPWAAEPPEPPPIEDEDLPDNPPAETAPNEDPEPNLF